MQILVIDDSKMSRNLIGMFLRSSEYDVLNAESGLEALDILKEKDVSLVITDILMPDMDGIELLETMKKNDELRHKPVIMLTALADRETVKRAALLGCEHYLAKPVSKATLVEKVDEILGRNRDIMWKKFKVMSKLGVDQNEFKNMMLSLHTSISELTDKINDYMEGEVEKLEMWDLLNMAESAKLIGAERVIHALEKLMSLTDENKPKQENHILNDLLKELEVLKTAIA